MERLDEKLKNKKIQKIALVLYSMILIYFLFFAFDRGSIKEGVSNYRYSFEVNSIPLWLPRNGISKLWIFSLGNLVAFVPLGMLISLVFDSKLIKTMTIFIISITISEFVQMITFRGSFDVEDILINSMGVLIGYISYKLGYKCKKNKLIKVIFIALLFVASLIVVVDKINRV